uniref:Putative K+ channel toxin n=1 Tax=Superstitionia donensis TaxID=311983 RepID=A0A1V1WBP8_9SCOR
MKVLPLLFLFLIISVLLPTETSCENNAVERSGDSFAELSRSIVKRSCKRVCSGNRRSKQCMQKCKNGR